MQREKYTYLFVGLLSSFSLFSGNVTFAGEKVFKHTQDDRIPNHYIVVLRPNKSIEDVNAVVRRNTSPANVDYTYKDVFKGFAARLSQSELDQMSKDPDVEYIEEDSRVSINDVQSNPPSWGLDRIDQPSLPLDKKYGFHEQGKNVNVYIVDTGILTTHQEIAGRAFSAFTSVTDGNKTNDCNGHGTHVSSTIGGKTYGVAKGAHLYAIRVLDCEGSGSVSGVIAGLDWVRANHKSPAVINMSLGGGASPTLDTAVENNIHSGVTVAVAAGNSNDDACQYSPARVPGAISAGASDKYDSRASFSNYGSCVTLFAPGVGITSAWIGSNSSQKTISGTSMASPHIAGVAALYLEKYPQATPETVKKAIIHAATADQIKDPSGSPNLLLQNGSDEFLR
jgi:subtilisin family serine protease